MRKKISELCKYHSETLKALDRYLSGHESRKKKGANFVLNVLYRAYIKSKNNNKAALFVSPTNQTITVSITENRRNIPTSNFLPIKTNRLDILYNLIDSSVEIVSFDIFDTLLERPLLEPSDLFHLIGNKYDKQTGLSFYEIRQKYDDGKRNFDEIYAAIEKGEKVCPSVIQKMKADELQLENAILRRREEIFEVYKFAVKKGKKVVAISDMYLPESFLRGVLEKNGYEHISEIYVSSSYNKRKDQGTLYDYVLEQLGVTPQKLLHIGDNKFSDFEVPLSKGIKAFHIFSLKELILNSESFLKNIFNFEEPNDRLIFGYLLNKNQQLFLGESRSGYIHSANDLGSFVLGPILLYITLWLLNDNEIKSNYKKILFSGRDGYLVERAYKLADPFIEREEKVKTSYLIGGRRLQCKLEDDPLRYCVDSGVINDNVTVAQLISSLIDDEGILQEIRSVHDRGDLNLKIHDPKFVEVLESCRRITEPYFRQQRKNLMDFYRGYVDQDKIAVFDVGYSGSVSDFLFEATGKKVDKIYLWESVKNHKKDLMRRTKTKCLFGSIESFLSRSYLHLVLEEIFSPLVGAAKSVDSLGQVNYENFEISSDMERDLTAIQSEMLELVSSFFHLYGKWISEFFPKKSQSAFYLPFAFFEESPYPQSKWLRNIKFNDLFLPKQRSLAYKLERGPAISESNDKCVGLLAPDSFIRLISGSENLKAMGEKVGVFWYPKNVESFYKLLPEISNCPSGTKLLLIADDECLCSNYAEILKACAGQISAEVLKAPDLLSTPVMSWLSFSGKLNADCDVVVFISDSETGNVSKYTDLKETEVPTTGLLRSVINTILINETVGILSPNAEPLKRVEEIRSTALKNPSLLESIFNFIYGSNWEITRADWVIPDKNIFCYRTSILKAIPMDLSKLIRQKNLPPSASLDTSLLLLLTYKSREMGLDVRFYDSDRDCVCSLNKLNKI